MSSSAINVYSDINHQYHLPKGSSCPVLLIEFYPLADVAHPIEPETIGADSVSHNGICDKLPVPVSAKRDSPPLRSRPHFYDTSGREFLPRRTRVAVVTDDIIFHDYGGKPPLTVYCLNNDLETIVPVDEYIAKKRGNFDGDFIGHIAIAHNMQYINSPFLETLSDPYAGFVVRGGYNLIITDKGECYCVEPTFPSGTFGASDFSPQDLVDIFGSVLPKSTAVFLTSYRHNPPLF